MIADLLHFTIVIIVEVHYSKYHHNVSTLNHSFFCFYLPFLLSYGFSSVLTHLHPNELSSLLSPVFSPRSFFFFFLFSFFLPLSSFLFLFFFYFFSLIPEYDPRSPSCYDGLVCHIRIFGPHTSPNLFWIP